MKDPLDLVYKKKSPKMYKASQTSQSDLND